MSETAEATRFGAREWAIARPWLAAHWFPLGVAAITFVLLYATYFADRLEKEIVPALKAGFIVLSDRYIFTALHRDEADLETNKASGFYQGTEIAVDQFVEHVIAMK